MKTFQTPLHGALVHLLAGLLLGSLVAGCNARLDISEETLADGGLSGAGGGGGGGGTGPTTPPDPQPDASTADARCDDGLRNGAETGVDCGGGCGACSTTACACASSPALAPLGCDEPAGTPSPCGERLLSADGESFVFTICYLDPETGGTTPGYQTYRRRADGTREALGSVGSVALSSDGQRVLVYDESGAAAVIDGAGVRTPVPIARAFASDARLSGDGSTVFGTVTAGSGARLARWTESGGLETLPDVAPLAGAQSWQVAGVNHDGSAIAGFAYDGARFQPFRWTAAGGVADLGPLPDGASGAQPVGISADGSTIVGYTLSGASNASIFRWTEPDQFRVLGAALPAGYRPDAGLLVSADGSVVVGSVLLNGAPSLVRWGAAGAVVASDAAYALDLTADGSTLVGLVEGSGGFLWQPPAMIEITTPSSAYDVTRLASLVAQAGADTTGWQLDTITNVSDDARVVYGAGTCGGVQTYYRLQLAP